MSINIQATSIKATKEVVKSNGRKRTKGRYDKLIVPKVFEKKQGIYLIYNDDLKECYVGRAYHGYGLYSRYNVRMSNYKKYELSNGMTPCHHATVLLGKDGSKMEWLLIETVPTHLDDMTYHENYFISLFQQQSEFTLTNRDVPNETVPFDKDKFDDTIANVTLCRNFNVPFEGDKQQMKIAQ